MFDYKNIPQDLKRLKNWVCWCGDKLPKNPYTGGNAQSNNPETWSSFEQAIKAVKKYSFDGVGFMFSDGYFGVDLDKCIDNQDFIDEFVETLQSYTEYSKSGQGIHIICKGRLPDGARRKGNVEMYQSGRYFIFTGNIYGKKRAIRDCTESIKILHSKYLDTARPKIAPKEIIKVNFNDDEIIDKGRSCKSGMLFQALLNGNWEGIYTSQSEADLAFCNMLAFWTQKNYSQMDRIFRNSGLYRPKWDEKRGQFTYGEKTLNKAISHCQDVYSPNLVEDDTTLAVGVFGKKGGVKKPLKEYDMTDTGNAQRFIDKYKGNVRYSYVSKTWSFWDGKKWQEDLTGELKKLVDEMLEDMKREAFDCDDEEKQEALLKWCTKSQSSKMKQNLLTESQHLDGVPVLPQEMDANADMFNCQNGIVNLRNGELLPHDSNMLCTKIGYSEYDNAKDKKPERWLKFLDEITDGDKELQRYLQKAVGYSLTGSIREQCAFFLYGVGNNGKSTFLDIIRDIAGSYSANVQPETIMIKRYDGNSANSDIARLKGSRFVTSVEPNEGLRLNEGLLKQLTGEDTITARFLYGKEFEFKPEFKLWCGTNHKPTIRGTDVGIWRRIRLIPFTVQIPKHKVDKTLKYKLRKELPQIFNWAVEGCLMWQEEGLEPPKCVQDAVNEYKNEMDILASFVESCINVVYNANAETKANDLYETFSCWAKENNEYVMSSTKFGKEFSKKFPNKVRRANGYVYKDIVLTDYAKSLKKGTKNYHISDFQ